MELYNAVVDGKYENALSFLRGFRDIFGQSMIDQIRRMYVGKFMLYWINNKASQLRHIADSTFTNITN